MNQSSNIIDNISIQNTERANLIRKKIMILKDSKIEINLMKGNCLNIKITKVKRKIS